MRAIDLINPAGEIAKECQNMLLGTTEKKVRRVNLKEIGIPTL